jgi:tetratricopeptide (TPR) repeat protein
MQPTEIEQLVVDTWNFDDPAATETAFHAQLASIDRTSPEAAVLLTQVARTHGLRGDFTPAHEALDVAAGILETLDAGADRDHVEARIAIERGRALNSSSAAAEALPYFEAAYEFATRAGTSGLAVDALHMQAIAVGQTQSLEAAAALNRQAIALAESSDDPAARRWRASLLNNLGWDQHGVGEYDAALDYFERALAARLEQESSPSQITVARWSVARALRSLGRFGEALAIQHELAADPANADDGYIPEEIGECLLELGRAEDAKPHLARAHALLSQDHWLVEHESERLARLSDLTGTQTSHAPG